METKQNQTKTICSLQWRLVMWVLHFLTHFNKMVIFSVEIGSGWSKSYAALCSFFPIHWWEICVFVWFLLFFNKYFENCSFPSSSPSTSFLLISLFHLCLWEYKTVKGGCHQVQSTSTGVANLLWVNDTHNACVVWATGNPSVAGSTWTQRQENSRTV